jgi:hypothetical protein
LRLALRRVEVREELYKAEVVRLTQALTRCMKDQTDVATFLQGEEKRVKLEAETFKSLRNQEAARLE